MNLQERKMIANALKSEKFVYLQDPSNKNIEQANSVFDDCYMLSSKEAKRADVLSNIALDSDFTNGMGQMSSGAPLYFTNVVSPDIIHAIYRKISFQEVSSPLQLGDFATNLVTLPTINYSGEVAPYDDFANNGQGSVTANFPTRAIYRFQLPISYGDLAQATMSSANIDYIGELRLSALNTINQTINNINFYGVTGVNVRGLLTDPDLPAAIPATGVFTTATPNDIIADIQALMFDMADRMGAQFNGAMPMTLIGTQATLTALKNASQAFLATPAGWLGTNYPNLKLVGADQYGLNADGTVATSKKLQLIIDAIDGRPVVKELFTYKYRSHGVVREAKSFNETASSGAGGAVIIYPMAISTMTGV